MTDHIPPDEVEGIFGDVRTVRHEVLHIGQAVSRNQQVYILHSRLCLERTEDLRDCPFSRALDLGIDVNEWIEDVPLILTVGDGHLRPSRVLNEMEQS